MMTIIEDRANGIPRNRRWSVRRSTVATLGSLLQITGAILLSGNDASAFQTSFVSSSLRLPSSSISLPLSPTLSAKMAHSKHRHLMKSVISKNLLSDHRFGRTTVNMPDLYLSAQKDNNDMIVINDDTATDFNIGNIVGLIAGQSSLILVAVVSALALKTPNYGLGPAIDISGDSIGQGILWTLPLGLVAWLLDSIEDRIPALQDVTKATQQITLTVLGPNFRPLLGLITSAALGLAAGIGEEMLFRGVMQYELSSRLVTDVAAVCITSAIFGALHAVTPLYALLAAIASIYFGWLYLATGNLAIAIACHAFYDLVALMYAHWTVTQMSPKEQQTLERWNNK
ncbi:CAAX protease self-immunity-domain containing protein [Nitzschia inconspicua]|uniref:CAAX protease self-immunity-domain containing protein n=1 Tax=Nitzschia inconspicua TaxID=303405 RepID=A0A9K3Q586_9STRA|nr:CAAX protease self-immunity-domain containing protein [Nitzschia inconspicua]